MTNSFNTRRSGKPKESAFERIIKLVSIKDRPVKTMRERLLEEGYELDEVETAIERACEYRFLDDERYARVLIQSRLGAGRGIQGVRAELKRLDINVDAWEDLPDEFKFADEADELERALAYLDRKPPTGKNLIDKAYRTLMRKGYGSAVSSSAAHRWYDRINS